ncbi:MAG: hypothetical protein ACRDP5_06870 [Streptosporangiaceae bacterium]
MDPYLGRQASEKRSLDQPGLFDDDPHLSPLHAWLESLVGTALGFDELARQAGRIGFMETHLRAVLTDLAQDGLAVREDPPGLRQDTVARGLNDPFLPAAQLTQRQEGAASRPTSAHLAVVC